MTDEQIYVLSNAHRFYDGRVDPLSFARAILQAATRDSPIEPTLPAWFDTFLTNVCELSDRNSPAEEQDAIVATLEELSNCALNAIEHCADIAPKGDGNEC